MSVRTSGVEPPPGDIPRIPTRRAASKPKKSTAFGKCPMTCKKQQSQVELTCDCWKHFKRNSRAPAFRPANKEQRQTNRAKTQDSHGQTARFRHLHHVFEEEASDATVRYAHWGVDVEAIG